jgi:hypothetical protein
MEIGDGTMASLAYFTMGKISVPSELPRLRKALLDCCRQSTPGLVRLLERMRAGGTGGKHTDASNAE